MKIDQKLKTMQESTSGTYFCGVNRKILRRSSNLEIMSCSFPNEKKHIWANSRKDGLVHVGYNIPYPILVNVNRLKPYTYVDQTLKGIQSSKDQKSLQSIDENQMEETCDENSENHRETQTIGIDHIVILEFFLIKLISQRYEQIPRPWLYNFIIIGLWGK